MEKKSKLKKFKLFDMNRDGKGVEPGEDRTPNLKFFFKQFKRKFSKIISLNLMMIFQVLPLILIVFLYYGMLPKTPSFAHAEFPVLFGMDIASSSAATQANLGVFSYPISMFADGFSYIHLIIGIIAVIFVATYGWQKIGSVYVLRGLVRGDSVFIWSDFFYAIKRNLKQGLIMGIIDCGVAGLLIYDFLLSRTSNDPFMYIVYGVTIAIAIIYIVMRFYIYLQIVTFDIKLTKVIKNAFSLAILGLKRNAIACLGLIIVSAVAFIPMLLFPQYGITVVLPLVYYLGVCGFIYTYAAYPVIKKYMIDPPDKKPDESENVGEESVSEA